MSFHIHGLENSITLWTRYVAYHSNKQGGMLPSSHQSPQPFLPTWRMVRGFRMKKNRILVLGSVQFSRSIVSDSLRPHGLQYARPPCPSSTPPSLPKLISIELVMPSNHLILCRPFLLSPSIFPSIRVFSNESALRIRWPKYWSFSFSISPSN